VNGAFSSSALDGIAHGNIGGPAQFAGSLVEYLATAEAEASWQLDAACRLVAEWFNASADVQDGYIRNHEWLSG
jgi:hypothetical protein